MTLIEIGALITEARKKAGYTQRTLADALFVTDKAVSKWERGICLPDLLLFSKISTVLGIDLDYLVSVDTKTRKCPWTGELRANNLRGTVAGKPLVHYLLSYFMLAGIKDIFIETDDKAYIRSLDLAQYGLNISFFKLPTGKTMIIYDKVLLFGVNLTRQFQNCMASGQNMRLFLGERALPVVFAHGSTDKLDTVLSASERKNLARGTLAFPFDTGSEQNDASSFVNLYEQYHENRIADLHEIAVLRGLISPTDVL